MATPVNPLLQRLLAAHRGEPDKVPKGHKTCAQWAKEWGKKRTLAQLLIHKGVEQGLLGMEVHRVQVGNVQRKTKHYYQL
jgi:hypothetical protein